jgi:hypothetical protein
MPVTSRCFFERHGLHAVLWDWDGVLVNSGYNFRRL